MKRRNQQGGNLSVARDAEKMRGGGGARPQPSNAPTLVANERTVHHVTLGPKKMYLVDADAAVRDHPKEWANEPWPQYVPPPPPVSLPPPVILKPTRRIFHVTRGVRVVDARHAEFLLTAPLLWRDTPFTPDDTIKALGELLTPAEYNDRAPADVRKVG